VKGLTIPTDAVRAHISGVCNHDFAVAVAPYCEWVLLTDVAHYSSAQQAYRTVTQAWDLPIQSADVSDEGKGLVKATLYLDNGNNYRKRVAAQFELRDGFIRRATLQDAKAVQYDG
jgi:hypothetical protein